MVIAGCTFVRRRLGVGLADQPAAVRAAPHARLAGEGAAPSRSARGAVALVVISVYWLILALVAQARDIAVPSRDVTHVVWHVLRATLLAMGAGLGAFALTMVFRHTVATLALLFVYSIGGEIAVNLLALRRRRTLVGGQQRARLAGHALPLLRRQHPALRATGAARPR